MIDLEPIRQRYRRFAETECRGYSDLYERLALAAANDDAVMHFVAARPEPQPNLLFAAVQYLTGTESMPATIAQLRTILNDRSDEVAALMARRRTQTNEVGRCAALLPALPPGPLALVEVGASAGLCLLLDRFFYDYGRVTTGTASSPVRLSCTLIGPTPPSLAIPEVQWRHGLDLAPIDIRDEDAARWLRACVWADHPHRRERLQAAIGIARAEPPPVSRGDLVDDLAGVLNEAPQDACLVVFHSAVLTYVTRTRRTGFVERLADASQGRDVVWISNEAEGVVPEFAGTTSPLPELTFRVGRATFRKGTMHHELLAFAHPHGASVMWLPE